MRIQVQYAFLIRKTEITRKNVLEMTNIQQYLMGFKRFMKA